MSETHSAEKDAPACTCKTGDGIPFLGHRSACPVIVAQWRQAVESAPIPPAEGDAR